jgi:hypothetical protein
LAWSNLKGKKKACVAVLFSINRKMIPNQTENQKVIADLKQALECFCR